MAALLAFTMVACRSHRASEDDILVRVGERTLRVGDVQSQIERLPTPARALLVTPEEQKKFVNKLIEMEILGAEARRLGYDRDPEVVAAAQNVMVLKLLRAKLGEDAPPDEFDQAEIERYYRDHRDKYDLPPQMGVTKIMVKTREKAQELAKEAREKLARIPKGEDSYQSEAKAFRELVFRHSEDPNRNHDGGDVTLTAGQQDKTEPKFYNAASVLQRPGDISEPVEIDGFFYVIRLRQQFRGGLVPLAKARQRIIHALRDQKRDRMVGELVATLGRELNARVFPNRLDRLSFDRPALNSRSKPISTARSDQNRLPAAVPISAEHAGP